MALLFLDLDGVLADFSSAALKFHKLESKSCWDFWKPELTDEQFWSPLGEEFWASLLPTPEMPELIRQIESFFPVLDTFLCSSPCATPGCSTGKARWVEKHVPQHARRLILTSRKEIFAGKNRILIDDSDDNCWKWAAAGGVAITFPRPWNEGRAIESRAVEKVVGDLRYTLALDGVV